MAIILLIMYITKFYRLMDPFIGNMVSYIRNDFNTTFFLIISNLIGSYPLLLLLSIIFFLLLYKDKLKDLWKVAAEFGFANVVGFLTKYTVKRLRPELSLITETGYSFPSMHSYNAMMIYGTIILILLKYYKSGYVRNISIALLTLLILLTGFSRIYLNVHYTSDVLAGFTFGIITLGLFTEIFKIKKTK